MIFMFGVGSGCLSEKEILRRREIASEHNAEFVVMTGNYGNCMCGHGCKIGTCPIKRYWFSTSNRGEPFNSNIAKDVMWKIRED